MKVSWKKYSSTLVVFLILLTVILVVFFTSKPSSDKGKVFSETELISLVDEYPNTIEEVKFSNSSSRVFVKLKNKVEYNLLLAPEKRAKLTDALSKNDISILAVCEGREPDLIHQVLFGQFPIAPYLDWLSEVLLQSCPGDGNNNCRANL